MAVRDEQATLCILTARTPGLAGESAEKSAENSAENSNELLAAVLRLRRLAAAGGWPIRIITVHDDRDADEVDGTVALAVASLVCVPADSLRRRFPHALLVQAVGQGPEDGGENTSSEADLMLAANASDAALTALLNHAALHWQRNHKMLALYRELGTRQEHMRQLSRIALALSTRRELGDLLEAILLEARKLAGCDAGSLYLIEEGDEPALVFKLAQNDSVAVPFVETRLPLESSSLAGYVAMSGEVLNIPDVYALSPAAPYRFNESFDQQMGYRTRSVLVLPMRDHHDQVVGVLQFINRLDPTMSDPVPFNEEITELLRAVASQAAVSIQKNILVSDVNRLFESFVQASVKTIEQRDPTTSGHSFRVARTTVALFEALPRSGVERFRALTFSDENIKEVRYAALLHDFGKVGVKEFVLLKANKLTDERLELIHYRIELQKERLRRAAVEQELAFLHHADVDVEVARRRVHRDLERELSMLDDYYDCVRRANRPNLLDDGDYGHLDEIRAYGFREFDGSLDGMISDDDLLALSVRRGSLTPQEREEIQSHVVHTKGFLSALPWPPQLAQVPTIAGAHHERLDGSGYPAGLVADEIPLASRVMMVCDVYDALTAMDRPYKRAISPEMAFDILNDEARRGLLDSDMVSVFIANRAFDGRATTCIKAPTPRGPKARHDSPRNALQRQPW